MAPVQDYEKSEIPKDYLYIHHPTYDIHGCLKNRQVIVVNELKFGTTLSPVLFK